MRPLVEKSAMGHERRWTTEEIMSALLHSTDVSCSSGLGRDGPVAYVCISPANSAARLLPLLAVPMRRCRSNCYSASGPTICSLYA